MIQQINADWSFVGTRKEIKKELGNFELTKEGWYITLTDTILAVKFPESRILYRVFVWNNGTQLAALKKAVELPVISKS